jgi:hypothetical protein
MDSNIDTPRLILVHGTFASDESDTGSKWWQLGSDFQTELEKRLTNHAIPVREQKLFKWQEDQNSETSRHNAARSLLGYLNKFEQAKIPYHLVGHSHGGSVIWDALKLSLQPRARLSIRRSSDKSPLDHMLSWTTVGTPFIHKSLVKWKWVTSGLFAAVALIVLGVSLAVGAGLLMAAIYFEDITLQTLTFVIGSPLIGWSIYVLLAGFVTSFDDGRSLRQEKRLEDSAIRKYGYRWYGIWNGDDEAINSLRSAQNLNLDLIATRPLARSPFVGRFWWLLTLPAAWISQMIIKRIAPTLNQFVSRLLKNKALGDDRPAPKKAEVNVSPFPLSANLQSLNERDSCTMRDSCDKAIANNVQQLRSLLRELATNPGATIDELTSEKSFPDTLLIHTSYFSNPGVLDLVIAHVAISQEIDALSLGISLNRIEQVRKQKNAVKSKIEELEAQTPSFMQRVFKPAPLWIIIILGLVAGSYLVLKVIAAIDFFILLNGGH